MKNPALIPLLALAGLVGAVPLSARAELKLPAIFGDNMVLQQQQRVQQRRDPLREELPAEQVVTRAYVEALAAQKQAQQQEAHVLRQELLEARAGADARWILLTQYVQGKGGTP